MFCFNQEVKYINLFKPLIKTEFTSVNEFYERISRT